VHGVYIKAFCSGVSEIIQVYKEHILEIERDYLKERSLTVMSLQQKFGVYFQMFPALLDLMFEVEEQSKRGGEILNALYQKCVSGNPIVKNMFSKILFCCHKLFFHQLNAWIAFGQLIDIREEFFIHKINHGQGA
jgi:gamma-tubulin complex component 4